MHDPASSRPASVVVLFPDDWAPYSPTLTRLVERLSEYVDVRVYALHTGRFPVDELPARIYRQVRVPGWFRSLGLYVLLRPLLLALEARRDARAAKHVVAVDAAGAVAAVLLGRRFHYLSLELAHRWILRPLLRKHACSILIQSRVRLDYLVGSTPPEKIPVHLVQNAPCIATSTIQAAPSSASIGPRLVYMGSITPKHGLLPMLALIRAWPEATLTLQGALSNAAAEFIDQHAGDLLRERRLLLPRGYVEDADIGLFLSEFDIGLCLYDLKGSDRNNFNYISSPSGKMFNYFAAGLPVLASAHLGLDPVREYDAGIQASSLNVACLLEAGKAILAERDRFHAGALHAAQAFDFRAATAAFVDQLTDLAACG